MNSAEPTAGRIAGRYSPEWLVWLALFTMALTSRLAYLILLVPAFDGYHWYIADTLLQYGVLGIDGVKTTSYEPLYPLFLTFARVLSSDNVRIIQTLQAVIDSIGAVYLYRLAKHLSGRERTAVFSATLYGLYPLLIRHAVIASSFSLLSTELIVFADTLVTTTTLARAAAAGMWLGLAILTRSMIFPVLAFTSAMLIIDGRKTIALAYAMTTLTVVSPWLVRNYLVNGAILPTRSGENLFSGNSKYTEAILPDYNIDLLGEYAMSIVAREHPELVDSTDEKELDRIYTAMAWEQIRARPLETLRLKLWNVAYFFWPRLVPSRVMTPDTRVLFGAEGRVQVANSPRRPVLDEVAYSVSYSVVAVAALVGMWVRRLDMKRDAVLWSILITFVAIHTIYFPATHYRVSMEFVLLFYAAVGLDWCKHEEFFGKP